MATAAVIDRTHLDALEARENERFVAERPMSMALLERSRRTMPRGVPVTWMDDLYEHPPVFVAHGHGATITDVDGHSYLDMYVADMSAFCGHAPDAVVEAVSRRMGLGNQFLMPGEDSIVVAEHLADRYGLPKSANCHPLRMGSAAPSTRSILRAPRAQRGDRRRVGAATNVA